MKTITTSRKFLTIAFAVAALASGLLATTNGAHASVCTYNYQALKWFCR
jgi:hypothetical protein